MASDAQKLISLSLTKIAQSRSQRKGLSLHKNLLVATVLQKARYIFMEEAYNMIHGPVSPVLNNNELPEPIDSSSSSNAFNDGVDLIALTDEENNNCPSNSCSNNSSSSSSTSVPSSTSSSDLFSIPPRQIQSEDQSSNSSFNSSLSFNENFNANSQLNEDKENLEPSTVTYIDLDNSNDSVILKEKSTSPTKNSNLKRKRIIAEWETEEAVLSILPKKHRSTTDLDDSVFLDESTLLSSTTSDDDEGSAMEIDRITSLVSIFSFGGLGSSSSSSQDSNKMTRSSSTPDLCSAQVKDQHELQQRHFLAMTV